MMALAAPAPTGGVGEVHEVTVTTERDVLPEIDVPDGIPGFPGLRRFALSRLDDQGTVLELRSTEDDRVSFVVVPSVALFPEYAPEIDDATAERLGLVGDASDSAEPLVLLVVTLGDTLATSTVNLLAPVVVNGTSRVAAQVVLDDATLPLRAPLPL